MDEITIVALYKNYSAEAEVIKEIIIRKDMDNGIDEI